MSEELGILFSVDGEGLHLIQVRPMTREEADEYILATIQSRKFYIHQEIIPPAWWVPISKFEPLIKTTADKLTPEDFTCSNCYGEEYEEDLED